MTLAQRDLDRLEGVDERLVNVVRLAFQIFETEPRRKGHKLMVVEGLRTKARQETLYAQGRTTPGKIVTWTRNSKHCDGLAVDCAPVKDGVIAWGSLALFDLMIACFSRAAAELGIPIRSGANWDGDDKPREKGETDSPHVELV